MYVASHNHVGVKAMKIFKIGSVVFSVLCLLFVAGMVNAAHDSECPVNQTGQKHGYCVELFADGRVFLGPYVNGEKHGNWVLRFPDGQVEMGPYADGTQRGRWVVWFEDGTVEECHRVKGKRHGRVVQWRPDGRVVSGMYRNGRFSVRWSPVCGGLFCQLAETIFVPPDRRETAR